MNHLRDNRIAESLVCAGLLVLLAVVFMDVGGGTTKPEALPSGQRSALELPPLEAARLLFDVESYGGLVVTTNSSNPFYTAYFVPAPPPAPPPASTRIVSFTYLGFYETADGRRKAFLSMDGETITRRQGEAISGVLWVGTIDKQEIVLLGGALKTNVVGFKQESKIELPKE